MSDTDCLCYGYKPRTSYGGIHTPGCDLRPDDPEWDNPSFMTESLEKYLIDQATDDYRRANPTHHVVEATLKTVYNVPFKWFVTLRVEIDVERAFVLAPDMVLR